MINSQFATIGETRRTTAVKAAAGCHQKVSLNTEMPAIVSTSRSCDPYFRVTEVFITTV